VRYCEINKGLMRSAPVSSTVPIHAGEFGFYFVLLVKLVLLFSTLPTTNKGGGGRCSPSFIRSDPPLAVVARGDLQTKE
jgi:hypothetical protein